MAINFSDLGGGGGGGLDVKIYPITNGAFATKSAFEPGVYAFKAYSSAENEVNGKVQFGDANSDLIAAVDLIDTNTGNVYSEFVGSINLTETATYLSFSGTAVDGFIQISYNPPVSLTTVTELTTSEVGYVLGAESKVFVFGGGGGGANSPNNPGGGPGGGSGYLNSATVSAGTYDVVIGAGGGGVGGGIGGTGGTSSFGAVTAAGGLGGNRDTGAGGDGGSGGGGGGTGVGGENGADGTDGNDGLGGSGSGTAITSILVRSSQAADGDNLPGIFYAGGNGGRNDNQLAGTSAEPNSASGGGGATKSSLGTFSGGDGGSGVIYVLEG